MSVAHLTVVHDPAELARRAADTFVSVVNAAIAERGRAVVALAGGSTPRAMNACLVTAPWRERVRWPDIAFYFGDERCVPPDHADSNFRMTRETLFEPLDISAGAIFRIPTENAPQAAADAYQATLGELGAPPVFDLLTLGMGPDGHTASLFPGTLAALDDHRFAVANFVPKFDAFRITLTPQVIRAARTIMMTAAGAEKADSLSGVIDGPPDVDRYPAQIVARLPQAIWFVDTAAAVRLSA